MRKGEGTKATVGKGAPGARKVAQSARAVALRILCRAEAGAYADILLDQALRMGYVPEKDRGLFTELVYGTLRWRGELDWALGHCASRPVAALAPWVRNLLRLGAYQLLHLERVPVWAVVDEAVREAKARGHQGIADFVNGVLRELGRRGRGALDPLPEEPEESLAVRGSQPVWLVRRWVARYGMGEAEALCYAMNQRPPLTMRVNLLKTDRDGLITRLEAEGFHGKPARYAPDALILDEVPGLESLGAYHQGFLAVQDEASILVGHLVAPEPGETVADVCAAPGGKSAHLGALMENRGRLITFDPHPARLRHLEEGCLRLGVLCVEPHLGEVESLAPSFEGVCDRVLVDAPCSNLGVIRRNPDGKWYRREEDLVELTRGQRSILAAAAQMVRPGGVLVYSTCSLEPEENEEVTASFLRARPDFAPEDPAMVGIPQELVSDTGFMRTFPHRHGTDGFSAVRLRRQGGRL